MIAGFSRELVPPADSASIRPFLAQIHHNWIGASDSGFTSPSPGDFMLPPKPTPAYRAFLGLQASAHELWSSSQLSVNRLASRGEAVVVMTLALSGMSVVVGTASVRLTRRAVRHRTCIVVRIQM